MSDGGAFHHKFHIKTPTLLYVVPWNLSEHTLSNLIKFAFIKPLKAIILKLQQKHIEMGIR